MPKKLKKSGIANVHENLKGFNISIDEFGEMNSNMPIDRLNDFLNENVKDKKLKVLSEEE